MDKAETFRPPAWATQPSCASWLEVKRVGEPHPFTTIPIDAKPYTVFGRGGEGVNVQVDDPACSRVHAALVHHENGKVYLIELQASRGTFVVPSGVKAERHRPLSLKPGQGIKFGDAATLSFTLCVAEERPPLGGDGGDDVVVVSGRPGGGGGSAEKAGLHKRPRSPVAVDTVRASHILVKHAGSRRPSSHRQAVVSRSLEEAVASLHEARAALASGSATFAELAERRSDCSSAHRGGDLGRFGRGKMQKPFEDATFALKAGQMSDVVHTDSGVHLILRTE